MIEKDRRLVRGGEFLVLITASHDETAILFQILLSSRCQKRRFGVAFEFVAFRPFLIASAAELFEVLLLDFVLNLFRRSLPF